MSAEKKYKKIIIQFATQNDSIEIIYVTSTKYKPRKC